MSGLAVYTQYSCVLGQPSRFNQPGAGRWCLAASALPARQLLHATACTQGGTTGERRRALGVTGQLLVKLRARVLNTPCCMLHAVSPWGICEWLLSCRTTSLGRHRHVRTRHNHTLTVLVRSHTAAVPRASLPSALAPSPARRDACTSLGHARLQNWQGCSYVHAHPARCVLIWRRSSR